MEYSIEIKNLYKNFKSYQKSPGFKGSLKSLFKRQNLIKSAVKNFNLSVETGEIIGLLGPNGAGKTTLMKILTGIVVPSTGELQVLGYNPTLRENEYKRKVALVMGQKTQLWWDIPALDSFHLLQKIYQIEDKQFKDTLNELTELLDVSHVIKVPVRKLSLGERMKLELMAGLLHKPRILFLDEPTIGLDLLAQKNIRHFLLDYHKKEKTTIVLTSHYMADVEALCQRIVLINNGEKAFDGPVSTFHQLLGKNKNIIFSFSSPITNSDELKILNQFNPSWDEEYTQVEISIPEEEFINVCKNVLNNFPVSNISSEKTPIEKVMQSFLARNHS